jgi:hypothetical protein
MAMTSTFYWLWDDTAPCCRASALRCAEPLGRDAVESTIARTASRNPIVTVSSRARVRVFTGAAAGAAGFPTAA